MRRVLGNGSIHPVVASVVGYVTTRQDGAEQTAKVLVVGLLVEHKVATVIHVVQELRGQALTEGREGVLGMIRMQLPLLRSSIP